MGVDLLVAAEALLPTRPDLAASIAEQALEAAAAASDPESWSAAAGLALAARRRVGDARRTAVEVLTAARERWDPAVLAAPAAHRLRVELALLAAGAGAVEAVRVLVAPVLADDADPKLRPAAQIAIARSATDPVESTEALRLAQKACADDPAGRAARAEVLLVGAAIARHDGAPGTAVELAEEGLRLLDGDTAPDEDLRLSLMAESIAALLDADDTPRARERATAALSALEATKGPRRQRALLQLTVASALAGVRGMDGTLEALAAAAQEAAESDAPELEAVCRSALGSIHDKSGRSDTARAEFRSGADAQHRDQEQERRFVAALDELLAREKAAGWATSDPPRRSVEAPRHSVAPDVAAERSTEDRAIETPQESTEDNAEPTAEKIPDMIPDEQAAEVDGIAWLASSPWHSAGAWPGTHRQTTPRAADGRHSAGKAANRPAQNGVARNGVSRTNGHDHVVSRRARHAKPDPSQVRAGATTPEQAAAPAEPLRAEPIDPLAPDWIVPPSSSPAGESTSSGSEDVETWMRTALDELDRVWGPLVRRKDPGDLEPRDLAPEPEAEPPVPTDQLRPDQPRPDQPTRPDQSAEPEVPAATDEPRRRHRAEDPRPRRRRAAELLDEEPAPHRRGRHATAEPGQGETDALALLARAAQTPVTKDMLADLARRVTAAPQHLPVPDDRTSGAASTSTQNSTQNPIHSRSEAGARVGTGAASDFPSPRARRHRRADASAELPPATPDELGRRAAQRAEDVSSSALGCAVVIDLARDGRRFAGLRAASVIREFAEVLSEHVPDGSRMRFDEPYVLALVLPGWEATKATRWMYRTLPALLADFAASEDIPGVQLRATVHDVDGPFGAQLLHRIDAGKLLPGARHRAAPRRKGDKPGSDREPAAQLDEQADSGDGEQTEIDSATVAAENNGVNSTTSDAGEKAAPFIPADAEGLGLADLLAGALAAYRSI
ncbi:hypothetical protein [Pseudonocardia thermophila]|uniref:hypothetical protein n=1 Tax=Pseudonocardia thermophila TaxID=1848 RepID=UPI00248D7E94|nr:hypothetical protein [Pseudonocardia thermophila]